MEYRIRISHSALAQVVERLRASRPATWTVPAGISRTPEFTEFLMAEGNPAVESCRGRIAWIGVNDSGEFNSVARVAGSIPAADALTAIIAIGLGTAAGYVAAACHTPSGWRPVHGITVVGPGLPSIEFTARPGTELTAYKTSRVRDESRPRPLAVGSSNFSDQQVWSRTIGALGQSTWKRLRALHWALVGCGRTGSIVAGSLARLGAEHLAVIDPDVLEPHNVGEMDLVTLAEVGMSKVHALTSALLAREGPAQPAASTDLGSRANSFDFSSHKLLALPESVYCLSALGIIKRADMIICCVDNPAARLAAAFLARVYLKPVLDIGTGIEMAAESRGSRSTRQMGADIRLILPDRCLLCSGGVGDLTSARAMLLIEDQNALPLDPEAWRTQRAGSLRSLNQIAVGLALRAVEDLVGGRLRDSLWLHLQFTEGGAPDLQRREARRDGACPLCGLGAQGDEGLAQLESVAAMFHAQISG